MAEEKDKSMPTEHISSQRSHPYSELPDAHFWSQSVAGVSSSQLLANWQPKFHISPTDKVITAGSCFAQHISAWLKLNNFSFLDTEPLPYFVSEKVAADFGYGIYSARYGNQYTPRQMLQTIDRAFGDFLPVDDYWHNKTGKIIDSFRPQIEANGFASVELLKADLRHHFHSVRAAFKQAKVMVFTLGLTECWHSTRDGAVFPLCPGVITDQLDHSHYAFKNLTIDEVREDLQALIKRLHLINPELKIILTVSPVPLVATYKGEHVLSASSYSKAVLRVACEEVVQQFDQILYFPSYEIITGPQAPDYFADNRRSVTTAGVLHVMEIFARTLAQQPASRSPHQNENDNSETEQLAKMEQAIAQLCDEEALDRLKR